MAITRYSTQIPNTKTVFRRSAEHKETLEDRLQMVIKENMEIRE